MFLLKYSYIKLVLLLKVVCKISDNSYRTCMLRKAFHHMRKKQNKSSFYMLVLSLLGFSVDIFSILKYSSMLRAQ